MSASSLAWPRSSSDGRLPWALAKAASICKSQGCKRRVSRACPVSYWSVNGKRQQQASHISCCDPDEARQATAQGCAYSGQDA